MRCFIDFGVRSTHIYKLFCVRRISWLPPKDCWKAEGCYIDGECVVRKIYIILPVAPFMDELPQCNEYMRTMFKKQILVANKLTGLLVNHLRAAWDELFYPTSATHNKCTLRMSVVVAQGMSCWQDELPNKKKGTYWNCLFLEHPDLGTSFWTRIILGCGVHAKQWHSQVIGRPYNPHHQGWWYDWYLLRVWLRWYGQQWL